MTVDYRLVSLLPLLVGVLLLMRSLFIVHSGPTRASLLDLVTNRHGKLDALMCAFWLAVLLNVWLVVYAAVKGEVPEGVTALLGAFNAMITTPIVAKVVFNRAPQSDQPFDERGEKP